MTFTVADEKVAEPVGTKPHAAVLSPPPDGAPLPAAPLAVVPTPEPPKHSPLVDEPLPLPEQLDDLLSSILCWKRPHGSGSENTFLKWLQSHIERRGGKVEYKATNLVCTVLKSDGTLSPVLFSSHVDTVHTEGGRQKIAYDPTFGHLLLDDKKSNCLGADDGVGVWLMVNMIEKHVPGTYVFHRGEERGAIGANDMLKAHPTWLRQFRVAVAFDRPRDNEVITHQGGMRCCSDKFADALADALNEECPHFKYAKSSRGVFTDTKVYRRVIDECTNIGVGYEQQHSANEHLNYAHAVLLRDALLKINWEGLPIDRDCTVQDTYEYAGNRGWRGGHWGGFGGMDDDDDRWGFNFGSREHGNRGQLSIPQFGGATPPPPKKGNKAKPKSNVIHTHSPADPELDPLAEIDGMGFDDLIEWVESTPEEAASLLLDLGSEVAALREKLRFLRGAIK